MSETYTFKRFSHDALLNYPHGDLLRKLNDRVTCGEFKYKSPEWEAARDAAKADRGIEIGDEFEASLEEEIIDLSAPLKPTIPTSRQRIEYLPESGLIRVPKAPRNPRDVWNGEWDYVNPREIRTFAQLEAVTVSVYRPPGYSMAEVEDAFVNAIEDSLTYAFGVEAEIDCERDASGELVLKTIFHQLKPGELLEWPALVSRTSSVVSIGDLKTPEDGDPSELLRYRFLSRGGSLMIIGRAGIGKSSLSMQAAFVWALGKPFFGVAPAGPIKSLIVQAENDPGDMALTRNGILTGLSVSHADSDAIFGRVHTVHIDDQTGDQFLATLNRLLDDHRPDLVWLDPLLAFCGCDVSDQEAMSAFLRTGLNPLLHRYDCAGVILHHESKPKADNAKQATGGVTDLSYASMGSSELANWPRGVLVLRSCGGDVFELHAAKRGNKLRWVEPDGSRKFSQHLAHSKEHGVDYWREATPDEVAGKSSANALAKTVPTKYDLVALVPQGSPVLKDTLLEQAANPLNPKKIGLNKARTFLAQLIVEGQLHEHLTPRPGTSPLKWIARYPQPAEEMAPGHGA